MSASGKDQPMAPEQENSGSEPPKQNDAIPAQTGSKSDKDSQQKADANSEQGKKDPGTTAAQESPAAAAAQEEAIKAEISAIQGRKEPTKTERQPMPTEPTAPAGKFTLFQQRPAIPQHTTPKVAAGTAQNQPMPSKSQVPAATARAPAPMQPRPRVKAVVQQHRRYQRRRIRRKNGPKRPMTAYMAFVKDHYRRLDRRWGNKVSLYGAELARAWQAKNSIRQLGRCRSSQMQQFAFRMGPKRPRSAYAWFVKETFPILQKVPNQGARFYGNELGRRWRALGYQERGRFQQMARDDVTRYTRERNNLLRQRRARF